MEQSLKLWEEPRDTGENAKNEQKDSGCDSLSYDEPGNILRAEDRRSRANQTAAGPKERLRSITMPVKRRNLAQILALVKTCFFSLWRTGSGSE